MAGTLNQTGAIALKVTETGGDTVLAQMIRLVESAQTRKAPIQRLADVISGYFTYGVLTLATLTFLFWYFIGLPRWPEVMHSALGAVHATHAMTLQSSLLLVSLKLAIAVLVIACPCALGLATPTAILVGSGMGAERGAADSRRRRTGNLEPHRHRGVRQNRHPHPGHSPGHHLPAPRRYPDRS